MRLYLSHPISGTDPEHTVAYYTDVPAQLRRLGFTVLSPMTGKGYLRCAKEFKAHGYGTSLSSNHAIYKRDKWMVRNCNVFLLDLTGATDKSIGCVMELQLAEELGKHTIVVMEDENVHRHAFVLDAADVVFADLEAALTYLEQLAAGRF